MTGNSSLNYLLVIIGFALGTIGMFAAFVTLGPLAGIGIFWVFMGAFGYGLYRLLTEDARSTPK